MNGLRLYDRFSRVALCLALASSPATGLWADGNQDVQVSGRVNFNQGSHLKNAYAMALDESGRRLFVGGYGSNNILGWDLNKRTVIGEAKDNITQPHNTVFHPGKKRLFVLCYDKNNNSLLVKYDKDLKEISRVNLGFYSYSLQLSPDGNTAYVGVFGRILAVDTENGTVSTVANLPNYYYPFGLKLDGSRNRIVVAGMGWYTDANGQYVLRSAVQTFGMDGTPGSTLVLGDSLFSIDALIDGDDLYVANTDANSIHVVNLNTMQIVTQIAGVSCPQRLVLHPTRRKIYCIDNYLDRFHVIDCNTKKLEKTIFPGDDPSSVVFDSHGRCYTANFWSNDVTIIDAETDEVLERIPLAASSPRNVHVDRPGKKMYVTNGSSNGIFVMDLERGTLVDQLVMPDGAYGGQMAIRNHKLFVVDPWRNGVAVYPLNTHNAAFQTSSAETNFIQLSGAHPSGIAVGQDNQICVPFVKGDREMLAVIDSVKETVEKEIDLGAGLQTGEIAVNHKTKRAYVADYSGARVMSVDLKKNEYLGSVGVERQPTALGINPQTGRIYVCNAGSNSVAVLEDDPLENLGFIDVGLRPSSVVFLPSKGRVYVLNSGEGTLSVINELTHKVVHVLALNANGESLFADDDSEEIYVTNPGSGQLVTVKDRFRISALDTGADAAFKLHQTFGYPNPARAGVNPVLRAEAGLADSAHFGIYDVSGNLVQEVNMQEPPKVSNGKYAYEYTWNVNGVSSGVYLVKFRAKKAGQKDIEKTFKVAVLK